MSEHHPIQDLMAETMEKIKSMVDVDTTVGTPITTPDGTTVIPVSRVTFGFGSGAAIIRHAMPARIHRCALAAAVVQG